MSEIPSHNHNNKSISGTFGVRGWAVSGGATITSTSGICSWANGPNADVSAHSTTSGVTRVVTVDASHTHDSQGGGGNHNNMQPYLATNYIIYAGV